VARSLEGKVALVAGASRGAGRGPAVALGEAGATVYCTGRTTRQQSSITSARARRRENRPLNSGRDRGHW
jgi:NAD(P)-dependent dehydrogenase (short-subunit alcohol dehydrogenase family)